MHHQSIPWIPLSSLLSTLPYPPASHTPIASPPAPRPSPAHPRPHPRVPLTPSTPQDPLFPQVPGPIPVSLTHRWWFWSRCSPCSRGGPGAGTTAGSAPPTSPPGRMGGPGQRPRPAGAAAEPGRAAAPNPEQKRSPERCLRRAGSSTARDVTAGGGRGGRGGGGKKRRRKRRRMCGRKAEKGKAEGDKG